jgi:hypothetical protein
MAECDGEPSTLGRGIVQEEKAGKYESQLMCIGLSRK